MACEPFGVTFHLRSKPVPSPTVRRCLEGWACVDRAGSGERFWRNCLTWQESSSVAGENLTMSGEAAQEVVAGSPPPSATRKECYFDRVSETDPEYLRLRNMAPTLRQDFNLMEQKKRVTVILQSPAFRDELESLIQEQMKKGNDSSNLWALRQIVDFMTSAPLALPTSPPGVSMVTPINDFRATESLAFVKGERLMRCKVASIYRLLDLFGWAQITNTYITV
ncbi:hypothetical protein scyTo_0020195, partial [Scyliorhinus torazame]|nr:hypothetical protein [Scyliorhinus torazame]